MGPPGFLGPQDPQVLQEKMGNQDRAARKAALARRAPQDPREARETPAPSAHLGSTAWQDAPDQQDHQGPRAPRGLQAQDSLRGLTTWKAPGAPSGRQPEVPMGRRDHLARLESRGILESWGHQGPRERPEQTELLGSPAFLAGRVQPGSRDQKEKKGPRERKATQGRTEWGSQASRDPLDPQGLLSTCRSRTERWRACRAPRAGWGSQASPDQPGRRETWAPEASRASRDPRARRVSRAWSSALTAER